MRLQDVLRVVRPDAGPELREVPPRVPDAARQRVPGAVPPPAPDVLPDGPQALRAELQAWPDGQLQSQAGWPLAPDLRAAVSQCGSVHVERSRERFAADGQRRLEHLQDVLPESLAHLHRALRLHVRPGRQLLWRVSRQRRRIHPDGRYRPPGAHRG